MAAFFDMVDAAPRDVVLAAAGIVLVAIGAVDVWWRRRRS